MILTEKEINKISGGSVDYFDRIVFASAIESALLAKLRGGVELPEHVREVIVMTGPSTHTSEAAGQYYYTNDQLLAYGDARALAAREQQWLPIESAPKDGTRVLVSWPMRVMDDEGFPNGEITSRHTLVTEWRGYWLEPEVLNASGGNFDDEDCFTEGPDLWQPLPPPPASPQEQT